MPRACYLLSFFCVFLSIRMYRRVSNRITTFLWLCPSSDCLRLLVTFFQEPLHNRKSRINRANTWPAAADARVFALHCPSVFVPRVSALRDFVTSIPNRILYLPIKRRWEPWMIQRCFARERRTSRTLRYQLAHRSNRYRMGSKFASRVSDNSRCLSVL